MSDKFIKPDTGEEVFRVNDDGEEVVNEKFKDKWEEQDEESEEEDKEEDKDKREEE